jgi:xylulose-5-phosphate/fructose-6-phosphate phosphoketolase
VLRAWLEAYRPRALLTADGHPTALVSAALEERNGVDMRATPRPATHTARLASATARAARGRPVGRALADVLEQAAATQGVRIFSPDELASNRLPLERDGAFRRG